MTTGTRTAPAPLTGKVSEPIDPVFRQIRDLVYQVCGIFQLEEKLYLMADACGRRMKALELRSSREYWDRLTAHSSRETEIRHLLNEVTIGETCLFRSLPQIEALRKVILPEIVGGKRQAGDEEAADLERGLLHWRRVLYPGDEHARRK